MRILRSRKTFIALSLLVPPTMYATLVYLHDEYRVFWQNFAGGLAAFLGGTAALVVLLGYVTNRTRREIVVAVLWMVAFCLVVLGAAFLWFITHFASN
jgi:hypothetical protein